ncbi:MAG: hypothetical protein M5U14_00185 [Acidimicrobiia bacterium]|nr:hypothetical protein [Acidimicrobiia bacterium]
MPTSVERAARAELDARERDDLDLVARVMTIANRAGNSLDTILARLARRPSGRRLTAGEAVAGVAFAASVVPALGTFSVLWRRAPWSIARDFVAFSSAFAAEVAGEAGPAPVPPPARR